MFIFFMKHGNINWDISDLVSDPNLTWFTFSGEKSGGFFGTTVSLLSLICLTSFGVWGLPQTIHKYYAVRDKKAIKQGVIVSTAFALLIGFIAYYTGALSYFFGEEAVEACVNPIMYPGKATIDRCVMMHDTDTEALLKMWSRVKGANASAWTYILIFIVLGGLVFMVFMKYYSKNARKRKYSRYSRK